MRWLWLTRAFARPYWLTRCRGGGWRQLWSEEFRICTQHGSLGFILSLANVRTCCARRPDGLLPGIANGRFCSALGALSLDPKGVGLRAVEQRHPGSVCKQPAECHPSVKVAKGLRKRLAITIAKVIADRNRISDDLICGHGHEQWLADFRGPSRRGIKHLRGPRSEGSLRVRLHSGFCLHAKL